MIEEDENVDEDEAEVAPFEGKHLFRALELTINDRRCFLETLRLEDQVSAVDAMVTNIELLSLADELLGENGFEGESRSIL